MIIGEPGGPDVDLAVSPWPSDHRAVVSTFKVHPIDAPPMIAVTPRRVEEGERFLVRTYDPSGENWTAIIVRRGEPPTAVLTGVRAMPHSYQRTIPLSSYGLSPGDYDALLIGDAGEVLKRNAFTIAVHGARPEVTPVEATMRAGAPISVRWRHAPGDLRDWIGLYAAGETDVTRSCPDGRPIRAGRSSSDVDDPRLRELLQALLPHLRADSRLLGSTEGNIRRHVEVLVHPYAARIDPAGDLVGTLCV
jgi:hypothetical protein